MEPIIFGGIEMSALPKNIVFLWKYKRTEEIVFTTHGRPETMSNTVKDDWVEVNPLNTNDRLTIIHASLLKVSEPDPEPEDICCCCPTNPLYSFCPYCGEEL